VGVLAVILVGCSSAGGDTTTTTTAVVTPSSPSTAVIPTDYDGFRAQTTACADDQPDPVTTVTYAEPGEENVGGPVTVTLETSCGPIVIELDPSVAPETVNSFVFLAEQGYFDGSTSHRVLPGFMMQAGDPTATGRGGPGYTVPDEFPQDGFLYDRGVVAMANAGSGTTGSQFFIMFAEADWLPANYTVFGTVTDGFEALDAIEALPLGMNPNGGDPSPSVPLESLYIKSVTVQR
jgi:cyclophilin family peptidyl-prolyl cis-trans isomerase